MTIKTIYIARHGYRANWLPPPHPPNPSGIDSDPPLAPHGKDQAEQLAAHIQQFPENKKPQIILSSPFYRCVETSQPISRALGLPIAIERGVGEWFKKDRDTIPEPGNYDLLQQFFPELGTAEAWDRDNTVGVIPSLNGEDETDIFERAQRFWKGFFAVMEKKFPHIERILIVTHAATKIALGMSLLGKSGVYDSVDENGTLLKAATCSLDTYEHQHNKWVLTVNGNCDFLEEGEEMNWNFHYKFEAGSDEDIKMRQQEAQRSQAANDDFQDMYITIDIPALGNTKTQAEDSKDASRMDNVIGPAAQFQISELAVETPLIKLTSNETHVNRLAAIDGKILQTKWRQLVGTDLIFDDYGELVGQVKEHLQVDDSVKLVRQDNDEVVDNDDEKLPKSHDNATSFLKRAMRAAKSK